MRETHEFGGNWTGEKLKRVEKYLKAYATIMNKQNFGFAYIDAFAGTGYIEEKRVKKSFKFDCPFLQCGAFRRIND